MAVLQHDTSKVSSMFRPKLMRFQGEAYQFCSLVVIFVYVESFLTSSCRCVEIQLANCTCKTTMRKSADSKHVAFKEIQGKWLQELEHQKSRIQGVLWQSVPHKYTVASSFAWSASWEQGSRLRIGLTFSQRLTMTKSKSIKWLASWMSLPRLSISDCFCCQADRILPLNSENSWLNSLN